MGGKSTKISTSDDKYKPVVQKIELICNLKHEHKKLLEESVQLSSEIAEMPENAGNNRSHECYDFNRVTLPEREGSGFFNASWVDGHKAPGRFLLCQAPFQEFVQDWWAMVFTYKIRVIVMLTRTVEEGQEVCFPYWSDVQRTTVNFGEFSVKTRKVKVFLNHVVTKLRVADSSGTSLNVKHFVYTDWPSRCVPRNPSDFLNFLVKVRRAQSKFELESGVIPMLIHSRRGLNRAGAFAAIDMCLAQYDESQSIDILSVVRSLRRQRLNCLSLSQHYLFCYNVVDEYSMSL